tara:strand:+ start:32 stop:409 length:378 start_codon:yes stop_codon:yes gene_type:complete
MIILTTSAAAQTISVIPRKYDSIPFKMSIRDDSTNITVIYTIATATTVGNYFQFTQAFSPVLVENHFYDIHLYTETVSGYKEDIFKDRIFCTDQDVNQLNESSHYELNEGQYTHYDGFNNTYTVR